MFEILYVSFFIIICDCGFFFFQFTVKSSPLASNVSGTGAIARGVDGKVIGISLNIHKGITSLRVAKALAIRDGLNLVLL